VGLSNRSGHGVGPDHGDDFAGASAIKKTGVFQKIQRDVESFFFAFVFGDQVRRSGASPAVGIICVFFVFLSFFVFFSLFFVFLSSSSFAHGKFGEFLWETPV
jgi:hypothetical protein